MGIQSSVFKQSFVEGLVDGFLRKGQVLNRLGLDPLLDQPEVVQFGQLPFLLLGPARQVGEDVGVEVAHEDAVYNVAEEDLEFQRGPLFGVLGVLFMHLLVDSADRVAIAYFELGEVLVFGVESFLEIGYAFVGLLAVPELEDGPVQFACDVSLEVSEYLEQFGVAVLILPVVLDGLLVEQVEQHLVDVELEGQQQERGEEVAHLHLLGDLLDEPHLVDLPLNHRPRLAAHLLLRRLILPSLPPQRRVFPQRSDGDPLLDVDFEHFEEEVVEQQFLLLAPEETLGLDVVAQPEPRLALGHYVVQDVDA